MNARKDSDQKQQNLDSDKAKDDDDFSQAEIKVLTKNDCPDLPASFFNDLKSSLLNAMRGKAEIPSRVFDFIYKNQRSYHRCSLRLVFLGDDTIFTGIGVGLTRVYFYL